MRQGVREINFCRLPFFACVVFGLNKLKPKAQTIEQRRGGRERGREQGGAREAC